MHLPLSRAALLAVLSSAFFLPPGFADEPQRRTEESLFVGRINKWQRIFIRKGVQWPVDHYDNAYYYAVDLENTTRDREGQGVFVESVERLLRCYGKNVSVAKRTDDELVLDLKFEASQSDAKSNVRIAAKKWPEGRADEADAYQIKFSGGGSIFDGFEAALREATDEAGFVQNAAEIRWEHFPETEIAAPAPLYDLEKVLGGISKGYKRIEGGDLIDQRVIEFDVPDEPTGGRITIREFEGGDSTVDLSISTGDHGWTDRTYYFENGGELFFVLDGEGHWRFAEGKNADGEQATIDTLRERRYYFHRGHGVRVLEKSASSRDAGQLKRLINQAKNKPIAAGDHARSIAFEGHALRYLRNSTAAIDYYTDGVGTMLVNRAREVAKEQVPTFDSLNAEGVAGDLNDDGEMDVVLVGGVRKKLQALAILGPLKTGAKTSLVDLPEVANKDQMPRFDVQGMDFDVAEIAGEVPEGFKRSHSGKGLWIEMHRETEHLHLYWNHKRGQLAKW